MANIAECGLRLDEFKSTCGTCKIFYHILHMEGSVFIWLSNESATFDNLVAAYQSRLAVQPSRTTLLGPSGEDYAGQLAENLVRRFGRQIMLSVNLSDISGELRNHIEQKIIDYCQACF